MADRPECDCPWPGTNRCECYDADDSFGDDADCYWCGGDGYVECDDPIQCTSRHLDDDHPGLCPCKSCGGSGARKDMTIW